MEEMQKSYMNEKTWKKKDNLIIIKPKNWELVADCPVCCLAMRSEKDYIYYKTEDCCYICAINFKFPYKEKWKKGWRPTINEARNKINNN